MIEKTILEELAEFAVTISFEEIPKPVIHQANRCLLDFMGCYWGGLAVEQNRRLPDLAIETNPKPEATLWGMDRKAGMAEVAFAHGCIGHHLEYDDGISLGAHWGNESIPAILAMAEFTDCGVQEVLTAIVVAYEVGNRVSQAFSNRLLNRGVHFPCAMGIFGAASGVARLAGLSVSQTAGALGNACLTPMAPYLRALSGAPIKDAYAGWPNALGLMVTRLSRAGWSGPLDLLEGPDGLGKIAGWTGTAKDLRKQVLKGMGSTFEIMKTYFKPFPCCRWLHAPAQAILNLRKEGGWKGEDVQSIIVEGPAFIKVYDKKSGFEKEIAARFSIPYATAAVAHYGQLNLKTFGSSRRSSSKLKTLARRVTIILDEDLEKLFPGRFQTRVKVKTRGGQLSEMECGLPWGPESPPTDEELKGKFSYLANRVLEPSQIEQWLNHFDKGVELGKRFELVFGPLLGTTKPHIK